MSFFSFPKEQIDLIIDCFKEIISSHLKFLASLESLNLTSSKNQRIGHIFMNHAASIKTAHISYCSNHPKFIYSIETNRDKVCAFLRDHLKTSDLTNESLLLTTKLSLSFRHLDKYPACLQEFQRYTDDAHPDRGNIQRAGFIYRELVTVCLKIRRQKEMELEVMLGNVKNWPPYSDSIQSLGPVIHMGPVTVLASVISNEEMKKDRYLVLFSGYLVLLTVSDEMTSFVFEKKLSLNEITLPRIPEIQSTKTTFELLYTESASSGKLIFMCTDPEDVRTWISYMHKCKSKFEAKSLETVRTSTRSSTNSSENVSKISTTENNRSKYWAFKSLLPHPPIQMALEDMSSLKSNISSSKSNNNYNNDTLILHVIEAYCIGDRLQVNKVPQSQETQGESETIETNISTENSKTSSQSIRKEIEQMKNQINSLTLCLKNERKARRKLKAKLEKIQNMISQN